MSAVAGRSVEVWERRLPEGLDLLTEALVLRSALGIEEVRSAARRVSAALTQGDLAAARAAWSESPVLAAVPCEGLGIEELASLATTQVAAQTHSRAVAPLLYYAVGGLPAALAYHWLSCSAFPRETSRFGHHLRTITIGATAWTTASLMTVAAEICRADSLGAERVQRMEGSILKAPAESAPVRVMAGALRASLADTQGQSVNTTGHAATPSDLKRAGSIAGVTVGLAGGVFLAAGLIWRVFGPHRARQA